MTTPLPPDAADAVWTIGQAAAVAGYSQSQVYNFIIRRLLPATRQKTNTATWHIRGADLHFFLARKLRAARHEHERFFRAVAGVRNGPPAEPVETEMPLSDVPSLPEGNIRSGDFNGLGDVVSGLPMLPPTAAEPEAEMPPLDVSLHVVNIEGAEINGLGED